MEARRLAKFRIYAAIQRASRRGDKAALRRYEMAARQALARQRGDPMKIITVDKDGKPVRIIRPPHGDYRNARGAAPRPAGALLAEDAIRKGRD